MITVDLRRDSRLTPEMPTYWKVRVQNQLTDPQGFSQLLGGQSTDPLGIVECILRPDTIESDRINLVD